MNKYIIKIIKNGNLGERKQRKDGAEIENGKEGVWGKETTLERLSREDLCAEIRGKQNSQSEKKAATEEAEQSASPGRMISHKPKAIPVLGGTILPRNYFECIFCTLWLKSCNAFCA